MIDAVFFTKDQPQPKEVKLPDGSVHTIHFRELSATEFRRFQISEQSDDPEVKASALNGLIAASVCDPDGKQSMTQKQAAKLTAAAAGALVAAILEVNGVTGDSGKKDSPSEG